MSTKPSADPPAKRRNRRKTTFRDGDGVVRTDGTVDAEHARAVCLSVLLQHAADIRAGVREPYIVGLADPPWPFRNEHNKCARGRTPYPTMTMDELAALPVRDLFAPKSVMFLWTTAALLPEGLRLLNSWGFRYCSSLYWRKLYPNGKLITGLGWWSRNCAEFILFGERRDDDESSYGAIDGSTDATATTSGDGPASGEQTDAFEYILIGSRGTGVLGQYRTTFSLPQEITAPIPIPKRHSAKPPIVRRTIGDFLDVGPHKRLELFARDQEDPRWAAWGLEMPSYWQDAQVASSNDASEAEG